MVGASGSVYIFFWFNDGSVCAAKKINTYNRASAGFDFEVSTKACLDDCGAADFEGSTYQKVADL